MALRSGLPDVVPWALNALSVASFSARPELQLPSLPGLLPALLQVPPHFCVTSLLHFLTGCSPRRTASKAA